MCAITVALATAVLLLHVASCMDIPAPARLVLSSQYFNHLLSWEKGPGSPDGVRFSVTIRTLSGRKEVVKECENVTSPLRCDLTEAFSDAEETYYVSVSASLGEHTSQSSHCPPFKPILNTTVLEPPLLSVAACNRSLCVSLRAPVEKLASVYDSHRFHYRLLVCSEDGVEFTVMTEGLRNVTLKDLTPGRRYCVNASIMDHNTTHREPVCADVPHTADGVSDVVVSVVLCLLMLLLLMCSPRLISFFFCLKPPLPDVLSSIKSGNKALLFTPAELINTLFQDRDSVQKTKSSGEEEDEEESVRFERIVQYLDTQGSSLLIFPVSSSCGSSGDAHASLGSSTGAHSLTVFEDGRVQTPAAPQETSPHTHETPHTHEEDGESAADVNLLSVTIRGASAEPHDSCSVLDELGLYPQNLLLTDPQPLISSGGHVSEEEEEEDEEDSSGYLSRN